MSLVELRQAPRIVGVKAITRVLGKGNITKVFIAKDAEEELVASLIEECNRNGIIIHYIDSRWDLGIACGLKVGPAAVALIEQEAEGEVSADN